jgi:eukaryotic-like serine/threonine-protein kinase
LKRCPSCSFANDNAAGFCIQCGVALAGVTADDAGAPFRPGYLATGTVVDGKYRIERVLGEGGMGVVYLAHDVHTDMPVVVKAIRAEFAHNPEFRARTLAEGRALARIDHPNVVRLNAVVVEPNTLYLVMQFIDGEPLDALIERHVATHTPVPVPLALEIFRMILRGVGAAHGEGLIHRDLKPANILVRKKDGVAKVTDFGIAKGEEDAKAGRGVTKGIIGSVSYMAPEQVRGRRDLDKRVDIYALGIVLFELLIGRPPFEAPSDYDVMRMHAEAPIPSVVALRADVPAELDGVIRRACAKERDHRFASTDEFLAALDAPPAPKTVPLATAPPTRVGSGTEPGNVIAEIPREVPWQPPAPPSVGREADVGAAGAGFAARGVTEEGSALPSAPAPPLHRPTGLIALAAGGALMALGAAVYFATASDRDDDTRRSTGLVTQGSSPTPSGSSPTPQGGMPTATTSPAHGADAPATASPASTDPRALALAALAGAWRSTSGRDYLAVATSTDTVEFRIQRASQHPRQGYETGDVRFELKTAGAGDDAFAVEDHIRPTPPAGFEYDPATSRESCVGTWTTVKGRKLTAKIDPKGTLIVILVQIRTGLDKFKMAGRRVTGCNDLEKAPAEPIESRLARVR